MALTSVKAHAALNIELSEQDLQNIMNGESYTINYSTPGGLNIVATIKPSRPSIRTPLEAVDRGQ